MLMKPNTLPSNCATVRMLRALVVTLKPHSARRADALRALRAAVNLQLRREIRAACKAKKDRINVSAN